MDAAIAPKVLRPAIISSRTLAMAFLVLLFSFLLGWATLSILLVDPVPVVPCRSCAKCSCPKLSGSLRCGCPR